jgi:hypothetical protein
MPYGHTTWVDLKAALAERLGDTAFWTDDTGTYSEIAAYLQEAMRVWGALTLRWKRRVTFTLEEDVHWYSLPAKTGTLAEQVTDQQCLMEIQYHLLEPLDQDGWSGSEQFTAAEIEAALERRRNQFLMETGLALTAESNSVSPAPSDGIVDFSTFFSPHVIDIRRASWLESGTYAHLWRENEYSADALSMGWRQSPGAPKQYSVAATEPLKLQLIPPPANTGALHVVLLKNGASLDLSTGVALGIPDNLAWVVKWGAMADLLGKEGKANDAGRARYCETRWQQGIEIARVYSVPLTGFINGAQVGIHSVHELDALRAGWENEAAGTPDIIGVAGVNLIAVAAKPDSGPHSIAFDAVSPAPIPATETGDVQLGREEIDVVLDYAHHIAAFKQGGAEFQQTQRQFENMLRLAVATNERLAAANLHEDEFYDRSLHEPAVRPQRDVLTRVTA